MQSARQIATEAAAKCLQCGYPRDVVTSQPRCPECGSEYPTDMAAELMIVEHIRRLRWRCRVLLVCGTLSAATVGMAFRGIEWPSIFLVLSVPLVLVSSVVLLVRLSDPNQRVGLAQAKSTPATQTLLRTVRRQAYLTLIATAAGAIACWSWLSSIRV